MPPTASERQSEQLRDLMIEVARTQLAAVTAAVKFWRGWVESADKYTQKISDELRRVSEKTEDSKQFVGRLADFSREYLREMSSLPTVAADHFANEIMKVSRPVGNPAPKRSRKVRAKA